MSWGESTALIRVWKGPVGILSRTERRATILPVTPYPSPVHEISIRIEALISHRVRVLGYRVEQMVGTAVLLIGRGGIQITDVGFHLPEETDCIFLIHSSPGIPFLRQARDSQIDRLDDSRPHRMCRARPVEPLVITCEGTAGICPDRLPDTAGRKVPPTSLPT